MAVSVTGSRHYRQSSAGAADPLSDAALHSRLVRSPPPSRARRRAAPFFEIHEKAKIVVSVPARPAVPCVQLSVRVVADCRAFGRIMDSEVVNRGLIKTELRAPKPFRNFFVVAELKRCPASKNVTSIPRDYCWQITNQLNI